jgi:uncharacterized protein YyaL (SSP411 family)
MNDSLRFSTQLDAYVRSQQWIGYDPYDLKAHPLYLRLQHGGLTAFLAKATANLFPLTMRRLLHVRPVPHAKAMALFAEAYLTQYDLTGEPTYRDLAERRLAWLEEKATPGYSGLAWGLPFDYHGRDAVPAGKPSVVVTSIAARSLLHAYESLKDPSYLEAAVSACRFLVADVPRYEPDPGRLCFSKMPGVQWHIHNANLMVAATLALVGQAAASNEWDDLVHRATNYTLAEQRADGAWYYWGPPDRLVHWVDHYHTGFVLRALDDLARVVGRRDLAEALDQGYEFYVHHLFDAGCIPRLTETRCYPVDIHSCAEAILCLSQLATRYDDALLRAIAVADWTLAHMRHHSGYFYYRRYRWLTIKIPYMRWAQAWMLAALTHLRYALVKLSRPDSEAI